MSANPEANFVSRLDTHIRIEFDLIGYRMTWLMQSQAFLFAAFAVCANSQKAESGSPAAAHVLLYMLPIVGMISAMLCALAIFAAHLVIERLKRRRSEMETSDDVRALGLDVDTAEHVLGNIPSKVLPSLLTMAWLTLLVTVVAFD